MENNNITKPPGSPDNNQDKGNGNHGDQPPQTMFGGLNLEELFKSLKQTKPVVSEQAPPPLSQKTAGRTPSSPEQAISPVPPAPKLISNIATADVIASLLKAKKNKRAKENSLRTYESKLGQFAKQFSFLPLDPDLIMDYLSQFNGETGRHRRNQYDLLVMLYKHALRRFGLTQTPMQEVERPLITHKPIRTFSLDQVRLLLPTPENTHEKAALELLVGHGWRQIEVRRIRPKDVREISNNIILCHGKEREELTPILPETEKLLRKLAGRLKNDDYIFRAEQTRHGQRAPLGEDGMSQLIGRLFERSGIPNFKGHDLRRTCATLIAEASGDEFLAMRLIRDTIPGLSNRYIHYSMQKLVEAFKKYSPLRLINGENPPAEAAARPTEPKPPKAKSTSSETGEECSPPKNEPDEKKPVDTKKLSPASKTEKSGVETEESGFGGGGVHKKRLIKPKKGPDEPQNGLVETGEG